MQFTTIDINGVYLGKVDGIEATPPDVGFYSPEGVITASSEPPTEEPGKWMFKNEQWHEFLFQT